MKTATVADLRNNFRRVSSWIENGELVEIVKRGRIFARLVPAIRVSKKLKKPDIMKRLKVQWGNRTLSQREVVELREIELEGEEG